LGCLPLPLLLLVQPAPALAIDWSALWLREEQRAHRALEDGEFDRAQALAAEPARRGSAAYRSGDFDAAVEAFSAGDTPSAHYNRGNALARAGRFEDAIAAYDAALEQHPTMDDALANRAAVQALLDQQPPPQAGDGEGDDGEAGEGDTGEGEAGEPSSDVQPGEQGDPSGGQGQEQQQGDEDQEAADDPGDRDEQEQAEDASGDAAAQDMPADADEAQQQALTSEVDQAIQEEGASQDTQAMTALDQAEAEAEQAIEQMLRRIPDDPGGLLRRKFALEHRRRQAEGRGEE
jgi:Ca-activated chloride channel homolog